MGGRLHTNRQEAQAGKGQPPDVEFGHKTRWAIEVLMAEGFSQNNAVDELAEITGFETERLRSALRSDRKRNPESDHWVAFVQNHRSIRAENFLTSASANHSA